MFPRTPAKAVELIDREIDKAHTELGLHQTASEEYGVVVERLSRLYKLKAEVKSSRINPDTALAIGANLLGILILTQHERVNVITSKALGFVKRV